MNKKKMMQLLLTYTSEKELISLLKKHSTCITEVIKECIYQQQYELVNILFESGELKIKWTNSLFEFFFKMKQSHYILHNILYKREHSQIQRKQCYLLACQYGDLTMLKWYHEYLLSDTKANVYEALQKACMHNQVNVLHEIYLSHWTYLYEEFTEQQQYYLTLLTCERGHVPVLEWLLSHFPLSSDVLDERTLMNVVSNEYYTMTSYLASHFSYRLTEAQLYEIRYVFRQYSIDQQSWFHELCKHQQIHMELYTIKHYITNSMDKEMCMVCYEDSHFQTPCQHYYCKSCLEKHRLFSFQCGMCRAPFTEVSQFI